MSIKKQGKLATGIAAFALLILVALAALPSSAAPGGAKNFKFSLLPATVNAGTAGQSFSVIVTNTSPSASSSNISSLAIGVPCEFSNITGVDTAPPPVANGTGSSNQNNGATFAATSSCQGSTSTRTITIYNLDPLKRLEQVQITFNADVTSSVPCGAHPSGNWTVAANTGSQLNGAAFTEKPVNGNPTTSIVKACAASISGQVWRDHNQNGQKDPASEAGQAVGAGGFTVAAYVSGAATGTVTYGSNGHYTISGLQAEQTYTVCETAPSESPAYLGWTQETPTDPDFPSTVASTTTCSVSGTESTGYSVTPPASSPDVTGVDFFNVRTIAVTACSASYSVGGNGDPASTVTMPADCKLGTYVFESWVNADQTQETDFYPVSVSGTGTKQITQELDWALTSKAQSTLEYDDDPSNAPGFQPVLFCNVDGAGHFVSMPTQEQPGATTCLMSTQEVPTSTGVARVDTIISLVDGKTRTQY